MATSDLDDETLRESVTLGHTGLKMAWEGQFDEIWTECPDIDGVPQRDIFFRNVTRWLPHVEAEAIKRGLHMVPIAVKPKEPKV
jgi:hypothetical protein